MERFWWFTWVKVGVLALALTLAVSFGYHKLVDLFEPYLLEASPEPTQTEPTQPATEDPDEASEETKKNPVELVSDFVQNTFKMQVDFESMIFDYANDYAQKMMEESEEERHAFSDSLG